MVTKSDKLTSSPSCMPGTGCCPSFGYLTVFPEDDFFILQVVSVIGDVRWDRIDHSIPGMSMADKLLPWLKPPQGKLWLRNIAVEYDAARDDGNRAGVALSAISDMHMTIGEAKNWIIDYRR